MLKNLQTQPGSNSEVEKYNSFFRNRDRYAVSAGWWCNSPWLKKIRMKVENECSPACANFGV